MIPDWQALEQMRSRDGDPVMPFQKEGVRMMVPRRHNLLADEPGLGKSVQAIALIEVLHLRKVLIITKATLKRGFNRHLDNWALNRRVVQIIDKKTDFVTELAEIVIVNYDLIHHSYIHQQLAGIKWDLLICDEAHKIKSMDAKCTKAVLATNGLVRSATRTLMMTGTPVLNRPVELFPMLKVLAPTVIAPYSDFWRFAKRYCDAWQDGFGLNTKGASNTGELNEKLRKHYMIRRLAHEVQVQLPTKRYEMVFIDSTKSVQDRLRIVDAATRQDFKYQELDASADPIATLRRETAEEKIDACVDLIQEYVDAAGKLVIFAFHHSVIERLKESLKIYNPVTLDGRASQSQRETCLKIFTTDSACKVFIGQIQAAGEGVDGLQRVCSNALFVEADWVPGTIDQACKRLDRIGQTKPMLFRFLVWADSVEEHLMRVALDKVKVIKEILK